jgi:outer membrane biosynthesis protein TonB
VYPSYKDPVDCYLAEASASRGEAPDKPSVSPREWAQTAAIGIALRNAGFGLQFAMAGEEFESVAPNELGADSGPAPVTPVQERYEVAPAKPEPTEEEKAEPIVEKVEEKPIPTVKPTTVTQPKIDLNYSWNGQYFG